MDHPVFLGQSGARTLFTIKCHSGKDISEHSNFQNEKEILLAAARQFKVVANGNYGNGLDMIDIEEIDPPLIAPLPVDDALSLLQILQGADNYTNNELEQMISRCQSRKLDLRAQCLNAKDMHIVAKQGISGKQYSILDLSGIEVTNDCISVLADALKNNKCVEELRLTRANLSDSNIRSLASIINSTMLKCIILEQNDISDEGANYLAEILLVNKTLTQLSLDVNRITSDGVIKLANAITCGNTGLQILNLRANSDIDDKCVDSVVNMIQQNQSLKRLDLRHCDLSNDNKKRLREVTRSKEEFTLLISN